ncbi:MAG TPA: virulence factor BrkB family protein, partial [Leclercia adecarboxylata]|nr:virulence factor BrkB family protein [Leclercia adecarboxylata]
MLKIVHQKASHHTRPFRAWLKLLWHRIDEDNMTTLAGNLAYVSLLSLVPLVAVIFALFAAFPMFSDVSLQLRHFVFANFMPATGDV